MFDINSLRTDNKKKRGWVILDVHTFSGEGVVPLFKKTHPKIRKLIKQGKIKKFYFDFYPYEKGGEEHYLKLGFFKINKRELRILRRELVNNKNVAFIHENVPDVRVVDDLIIDDIKAFAYTAYASTGKPYLTLNQMYFYFHHMMDMMGYNRYQEMRLFGALGDMSHRGIHYEMSNALARIGETVGGMVEDIKELRKSIKGDVNAKN